METIHKVNNFRSDSTNHKYFTELCK